MKSDKLNKRTLYFLAWQSVLSRLSAEYEILRKNPTDQQTKEHIQMYSDMEEDLRKTLVEIGTKEELNDFSYHIFEFDKYKEDRSLCEEQREIKRKLDLLNKIVDSRCEEEGAENTAEWIMSFGITGKELEKWGWDPEI